VTEGVLLSDDETYRALIQLLRDLDLAWVAEEVEQAVLVGDVEIRDAPRQPASRGGDSETPELRAIPSLQVHRTQFGPRDQINLAVNAIRHVVVEGFEMEAEVREELGARVLAVEDDEQSEPQPVVREGSLDVDAIERLHGLLTEVERGG
jgi:hypothetical protein